MLETESLRLLIYYTTSTNNSLYNPTSLETYHYFMYLYLTYCIEIWGNASAIQLEALKERKKFV